MARRLSHALAAGQFARLLLYLIAPLVGGTAAAVPGRTLLGM